MDMDRYDTRLIPVCWKSLAEKAFSFPLKGLDKGTVEKYIHSY